MPVRKTERRIPFYFQASDLGQHVGSSDGKAVLVSYMTSPVVTDRMQRYILFVTDSALAGQADHFDWRFENESTNDTATTQKGCWEISPQNEGTLKITVEIKNSSNQSLSSIQMNQVVIPSNEILESMINQGDVMAPTAGNPATSREIINDYRGYIDQVAGRDLDADGTLNRLLFAIACAEAQRIDANRRAVIYEQIADSFESDDDSVFVNNAGNGIGLCQIKPHMFSMYFSSTNGGATMLIDRRELPSDNMERNTMSATLMQEISSLSANDKIDLFNILRFPKLNLKMCKHYVDQLKEQYFSGQNYSAVFGNRSNGIQLIERIKKGPFPL